MDFLQLGCQIGCALSKRNVEIGPRNIIYVVSNGEYAGLRVIKGYTVTANWTKKVPSDKDVGEFIDGLLAEETTLGFRIPVGPMLEHLNKTGRFETDSDGNLEKYTREDREYQFV